MGKKVLELKNVSKSFGKRKIIDNLNLEVEEGEIYGFLGPNGSGKTTTIKMILRLINSDSGEIKVNGYDTKKQFEKAMECIGAIVENPDLYKYMSKGNTEIFEFDDTKKNNSNSENSRQNTENSNTDSSEVNIDSNNKNNSVNTGDITEKHNSQVDEGQQETTVNPESNNAENYDDQVMALADDNYEPFTLASTPDSAAAANSDDDNNFIFYVSLIGLVAVVAVLLIIRLTVLKKDGEPFRLFGKRKGDK